MMALKKQDNIKCAFLKEVHQASNNNFNLLCLSQFLSKYKNGIH